MPTMMALTVL